MLGRNDEGIFELRRAESLDPLSLIISADVADALCIAHLYDESVQQSKKTIEMDSTFALAHFVLGQALEQKLMHEEAIAEFHGAIELSGLMRPSIPISRTRYCCSSGRKREATNSQRLGGGATAQNPSGAQYRHDLCGAGPGSSDELAQQGL